MKNTINEDRKWRVLSSEYLFRRPWLTARKDVVKLPDGRVNPEYYVLEYPDWVNVIALTADGQMILERQYRHGLGKTCYELPCGVIEEGETPLEAAKRELLEETGAVGFNYVPLGAFYVSPGFTDEIDYLYMCRVDHFETQQLDDDEFVNVERIPLDKAVDMALNNMIPDGKTQTAILKTALLLKN